MTTDIRVAAAEKQAARPDVVEPPQRQIPAGRAGQTRGRRRVGTVLTWIALCLIGIVFVYPFIWLVSASFKPRSEVFDNRLIPQTFTFDNYVQVWQEAPLALWLLNTAIVTVLAAVTVTISSAMVAWGFAYFRFRGRGFLFGLVLATMMLPGAVTMIPTFLIWNALGQVGTLTPLWAGNLFGSAFYIFLLRQFFLGLPRDLFEAARIDGASQWGVFWRIALPLTGPALAVVLVFEVQAVWTDLMKALIYLRDSSTFTIPRGLKSLVDAYGFGGEWHWEIIVTASVITTVPLIIVFFLAQKRIIDGVASTGLKG
ncbi:multiple sugar transport system permease protein [Agromyces flavus]|uniref:Carbohydrate ABC transporter membrane protein 2, CUT1 family n=1 Tax=Agromyces flavus TaxID=589382 RepID=A0A1H1Y0N4_9MICO|nr:carbohydrate ABC transporter permease [Agromyces flavus]MCP2366557.1 multiple sugar transport system permease protein [Agromyces flavus]GGI44912.1 sugar ABC transporter permease [Agromyces flavus]SDT15044.1 carbohydrate ABC transporter membrane protein 2, CUT1 family [Agromyces flavus]